MSASTPSRITLTRRSEELTVAAGVSPRRLGNSKSVHSTIPMVNYKSASYRAEVLVNGHKVVVLVDTGSSDFWISCAYASDFGCSTACPYTATVLLYGSGSVCVVGASGTLQVGDLELKDYVISVGQGRNMVPNTKESILPPGTEGLFGLAYASLAAIPNTQAGQFIEHLHSFSIYLTDAANSTGSFLMLNGVDKELIAREKWAPFTVPLVANPKHWTIGMTAFQVGDDAVQFPCSRSGIALSDDPTRCESIVDTGTSLLSMPSQLFAAFAKDHLVPQGCMDARDVVVGNRREIYFCEASVTLPRLSFTFDDFTFYLSQKDYVVPVPETQLVMVEIQRSGFSLDTWILGDTFLKRFYASYEVDKSVTFYCQESDCAKGVVANPVQPQARKTGSSASTTGITDTTGSGDASSNSSGSSATVILAVVLSVVGVALLVAMFLFVRARKRRAAAAAEGGNELSPMSVDSVPVVGTPVSDAGAFYAAPVQSPVEQRV
ncbi:hypothetical protein PybrP1_013001 [[Pythium] brassicae (nom. inval.)]|nr:hypothetical protein PybrP1_013001 [[Pythium] brassicae (nom. inval.)]